MEQRRRSPSPKAKSPETKRRSAAQRIGNEQLMATLKKKRECNQKAQKVVEKLLDPFDDEKELLLLVCRMLLRKIV